MFSSWRASLLILVMLPLAGCVASDFEAPITRFSGATDSAATSLSAYEKVLDAAALDANLKYALAHPNTVRSEVGKGECTSGGARCRLVIRDKDGKQRPLDPGPLDPTIRVLMAGLVDYGHNLNAIATAKTADDLNTAMTGAKGAVIEFAKAADSAAPGLKLSGTVTNWATPLANAATFGLQAYAEGAKLRALRSATAKMDPLLASVATVTGAVATQGNQVKRIQAAVAFSQASDDFDSGANSAKLKSLMDSAHALDALLTVDPADTFATMVTAHAALAKALAQPRPDFAQLWSAIQRLSANAEKLAEVVKQFQQAAAATP
jgi:hypothetical protein